jgi:hypothetical protein
MLRVAAFLLILFTILLVLRGLRQVLAFFVRPSANQPAAPREIVGEMVRDPVCGTWIDRRLAMPAGGGAEIVSVCSEKCRNALEAARR